MHQSKWLYTLGTLNFYFLRLLRSNWCGKGPGKTPRVSYFVEVKRVRALGEGKPEEGVLLGGSILDSDDEIP